MKKIVFVMAVAALFSCGNKDNKTTATTDADPNPATATNPPPKPLTPEQEKGETLIAQSDCLGCHKLEEKLQGPSYHEVANKYAGQPGIEDTLAQHIIKGHIGTWGQVQMTAHPALAEADAKAMVAYILSLKQ